MFILLKMQEMLLQIFSAIIDLNQMAGVLSCDMQ